MTTSSLFTNTTTQSSGAAAAATSDTKKSSGTEKSNTLDYNAFLQLLIAQMKAQDPTQPTDSTQFVSQLASFSSVEQQVNTNAKLDQLVSSNALSQAGSLIGHTLTSADGSVTGKVASVNITSTGAVAILEKGQKITVGPGITVS